jgi:magnesium-transporting ATPase (P-type)
MEEFKNTQFETKTDKETVSFLLSDTEKGLSEAEAKARLEKYGPNKLEEKKYATQDQRISI